MGQYLKLNNVPKTSNGSAAAKTDIIVIDVDDVLVFPPRDNGKIEHVGDITMKPGTSGIIVYSTKSKTEASYTTEGDEDAQSVKQTFKIQHPGEDIPVMEFVANWTGRNVIVLSKSCSDTVYKVSGTKCAPLQLKAEGVDNNDSRHTMITFEAFAKSEYYPGKYSGTVPVNVVNYKLTSNSFPVPFPTTGPLVLPSSDAGEDVLFSAGNFSVGEKFTLIGSGGDDPLRLEQGVQVGINVILKNDTPWIANDGATITFECVVIAGVNCYLETQRSA